jgi:flavin-dependent dehydrogenase
VTWRFAESHAGPGYFVVGDAGTVFDPLSSHGVLRALLTGLQAAASIVHIIKRGGREEEHHAEFARWVSDWQVRDQSRLESLYASAGLDMEVGVDLPAPNNWLKEFDWRRCPGQYHRQADCTRQSPQIRLGSS